VDQQQLRDALLELTGSLKPGPESSAAELRAARTVIAHALASGQSPAEILPEQERIVVALHETVLRELASDQVAEIETAASAASAATLPTRVFLSTSAVGPDLDPATPTWARGTTVAPPFGPFLAPDGRAIRVHQITPGSTEVKFVADPGGQLIAVLPVVTASPRDYKLGSGTVWLAARLLVSSLPANTLVGFRIQSGDISFSANTTIVSGVVHVPASATIKLVVTLDPPAPPPLTNGPGVDATHATANLPATVTFQFGPSGTTIDFSAAFSLTVYGTTITLTRNASPAHMDPLTGQLVIPATPSPAQFTVASHLSTLFAPGGTAPITDAGWALAIATPISPIPGDASGAGSIFLGLGPGIQASWAGSPVAAFQTAALLVSPGKIAFFGSYKAKPFTQTFQLWKESATPRNSSADFTYGAQFVLSYASQTGAEQIQASGSAAAHVDRPIRADGTRFRLQAQTAFLTLSQTTSGNQLNLVGLMQPHAPVQHAPIALENALILVAPAQQFTVAGSSLTGNNVNSGSFSLAFRWNTLLPTLPDPYAASFSIFPSTQPAPAPVPPLGAGPDVGSLSALITWAQPATPLLAFTIAYDAGVPPGSGIVGMNPNFPGGGGLALLDVSSNADRLGLRFTVFPSVPAPAAPPLVISGLALSSTGINLGIFTLPQISWEPMFPDPSAPPPPNPSLLEAPPNDGGPAEMRVPSIVLAPMEPAPLLKLLIQGVNNSAPASIHFTLPFGLTSSIDLGQFHKIGGSVALNQHTFPNSMTGALQMSMQLPGSAAPNTLFPGSASSTGEYGKAVLGQDVSTLFDNEFNPSGAPLRRYDLCGFGASLFSQWSDQTVLDGAAQVIKAHFDVIVGRTAFEVIEVQSALYPWDVKVVRTVTIERFDAGWVNRYDSGWQAASPGVLKTLTTRTGYPVNRVHPGPVPAVFNVRSITDNGTPLPVTAPVTGRNFLLQPVLFNADVQLAPGITVTDGGFTAPQGTLVPSTGMVGYIQIAPATIKPGTNPPAPDPDAVLSRDGLAQLLTQTGPLGGPIACTVQVNAGGPQIRGTQVDVSAAPDPAVGLNDASIVAALRGSPLLPRDGAWSLGKKAVNQTAPQPLDPQFPVPVVQPTGDAVWHLADPVDIPRLGTPFTDYGLLQSTGTQKLFFPRAQVPPGLAQYNFPIPSQLADVAALLNTTGIFPDLGQALQLPPQPLSVSGTDLAATIPATFASVPDKTLMNIGPVQVLVSYTGASAKVVLSPTLSPRWSITLGPIQFKVIITDFGTNPLLTLQGTAYADANTSATVHDLTVTYGGFLKALTQIFDKLQSLASFLPGGGGSGLDVSLSDGKLTVRSLFAIPSIPLGLGEISNIALDLGCTVSLSPQSLEFLAGISTPDKPFHWLYSPLSGTGCMQVGVRDAKLLLLVQAGLGVGLEIDLGIAKGAASIVLALQIDNTLTGGVFEVKVMLIGNASVDVLDGLASASITMTCGLAIEPFTPAPGDVTMTGSVAVGIHISICWVVDVDWDGSWQYTQEFDSPVSL
jgi:hypothetical protein